MRPKCVLERVTAWTHCCLLPFSREVGEAVVARSKIVPVFTLTYFYCAIKVSQFVVCVARNFPRWIVKQSEAVLALEKVLLFAH